MTGDRTLADYLKEAISENYLMTVLVTSFVQGKLKSRNLPFGLGKTTLALWLSYYLNGNNWDTVFERLTYNPFALGKLLKPGSARKNCVVWDDVQATAPAEQGVPRSIRRLSNFLSTERPEIASLIMTAPNISLISSPIRKLILFEVIVSERGRYEVQKISYFKNFRQPLIDLARLTYLEESCAEDPFLPLPPEVMQRYNEWRVRQKLKLYPSMMSDLELYSRLKDWDGANMPDVPMLESTVVKAGRGYVVNLPFEVGKLLHMQRVKFTLKKDEITRENPQET
jgi:hypothetical protein